MSSSAIEAIHLSKSFQISADRRTSFKERFVRGRAAQPAAFWALRDANFTVRRGESMGIIGPNGSGKSTALKVLTGIYRPTSGEVRVDGSVSALLEVGAGFHPELTGRQNIRLNATILGFSPKQINAMMDEVIEFADIGDHIDAPIKHYSSGMYVRLGFAVAVMVRPDILIVDEVIAVGDEEFQRKCYDHLHTLRKAGTTMLIVSHGLSQIINLCDEAVWLDSGQVVETGSSRTVVQAYLDRVNSKEARRAANSGTESVKSTPSGSRVPVRRGSGEVRVERIEILQDGVEVGFVEPGAAVTFRIHYLAAADVPSAVFGLGFTHESGALTSGPNSESTAGGWRVRQGTGHVDFDVRSLILQPGSYDVATAIVDGTHSYDYVERQVTLKVRATGPSEPGLVRMDGTWRLSASAVAAQVTAGGES